MSKIDAAHITDLREVYLYTFDSFATTPADVADQFDGINQRYARELLGTLVTAGLAAIGEGDEGDVWQTIPTYDHMSLEEAQARFDEWAESSAPQKPASNATKKPVEAAPGFASQVPSGECLCGCGQAKGKKWYLPGHDARHAGVVGRQAAEDIIATTPEGESLQVQADDADRFATLPSLALREKAMNVARTSLAKEAKRRAPKPVTEKAPAEVEHPFPVNQLSAREKRAYVGLPKEQRTGYRKARIEGSSHAEAMKAAAAGPEHEDGTVKVGKAEFIARRVADGTVTYYDAKGAEQVASKTAAKSFQVG